MTASIMSPSITTNFEAISCALRDVRTRYQRNSRLQHEAIADRSGADPRRGFSLLDDRAPNPRREGVNHKATVGDESLLHPRPSDLANELTLANVRDAIRNQSRS
jgi:hypothetical protein